jgi:FkbM family methyltransferase
MKDLHLRKNMIDKLKVLKGMIRNYENWRDIILNQLRIKGEYALKLRNGFKFFVRSKRDAKAIEDMFFKKCHVLPDDYLFKKNPVLIDMGAHIGAYSIWAYSKNKTATIISLEPDPRNFRLLKKNIKHNNIKNIHPVFACVSEKTGPVDFFLNKRNPMASSLVIRNVSKIKSSGFTIKDIIEKFGLTKIDVLKLDIEGAEFDILLGLDKRTLNMIDFIDVEYHLVAGHQSEKELEETLKKNGFQIILNKRYHKNYLGIIYAKKGIWHSF